MNGRCETCKWFGPASSPPADGDWGTCGFLADPNFGLDDPHSERAFTRGAHGDYWSWLDVRADFGCVEHALAEGHNPP